MTFAQVTEPEQVLFLELKGFVMHFIWSLIVGLVSGAIAKAIMPGKDPGGLVITTLLGVVGAMVAGFLGRVLGIYHAGATGPGIIASVIGAFLVLAVYHLVRRKVAH